jgi:anaerobic magnesium-protoporphyrin IX monomethyl ester cyclase
MRVLLLNPPAAEPVARDYYCSHVTKGPYYWPQIDLLALSGRAAAAGHEVAVLDAVVEGLSPAAAMDRVRRAAPNAVLALTGAVAWSGDAAFVESVGRELGAAILVMGDFARAEPRALLERHRSIDGVILDFTDCDLDGFLAEPSGGPWRNIFTRHPCADPTPQRARSFSYPTPHHELFPLGRYHLPTLLHHPFTVLMTEYGCPFDCSYCYFERIDSKRRDLGDTAEELRRIRSLGIREIELMDPSFGSVRKHALAVCEAFGEVAPDFSWSCEMRVDAADEELLSAMKRAGCHTVMFGVETPSEEVLARHRKPTDTVRVIEAFAMARRLGIRTLAHFMIGLVGETPDSMERLLSFALELDPDFASFNVARPNWNTSFREEVEEKGWIVDAGVETANEDFLPVWESPDLGRDRILELRDRAHRDFYLRPGYILRQLRGIRTPYQLKTLARSGAHLAAGALADRLRSR